MDPEKAIAEEAEPETISDQGSAVEYLKSMGLEFEEIEIEIGKYYLEKAPVEQTYENRFKLPINRILVTDTSVIFYDQSDIVELFKKVPNPKLVAELNKPNPNNHLWDNGIDYGINRFTYDDKTTSILVKTFVEKQRNTKNKEENEQPILQQAS